MANLDRTIDSYGELWANTYLKALFLLDQINLFGVQYFQKLPRMLNTPLELRITGLQKLHVLPHVKIIDLK
jgi:hypothetical protein